MADATKSRKTKASESLKPTGLHRFLIAIKDLLSSTGTRTANDPISTFCREKRFTYLDEQSSWPGMRMPRLILNVQGALTHLNGIGCTTVADFIGLTGADPRMLYYDRVNVGTSLDTLDRLRHEFWACDDIPDDAALAVLQPHMDLYSDDLTVRAKLYQFMEKNGIEDWFWLHEWVKKEWKARNKPKEPKRTDADCRECDDDAEDSGFSCVGIL